jgi:glycosyltransferase involved in cell wall biosynthesis
MSEDLETCELVIGIDASRNRSGGAIGHLVGMLSSFDPRVLGVRRVHVWSYPTLLAAIPDKPWIIKHAPPELEAGIVGQIWWQFSRLHLVAKEVGCTIMLNTGAGTFCRFRPSITMSRDMLSFEPGEMQRYPLLSKERLRLCLIKHLQIRALKKATAVIFLTKYAASALQRFTGRLSCYRIIPHGIDESFRQGPFLGYWDGVRDCIRCVYVSNVDLYKHQWNVIEAIAILRKLNYPVILQIIGGGSNKGKAKMNSALVKHDPKSTFVHVTDAIPHKEIPNHLASADIFIFASSCENMPNSLIEGMASGLPIASSHCGPMPEILGESCAYFDPESPVSIAMAIESLLIDSTWRQFSASQVKAVSDHFSWERCSRETFSFLVEVLKKSEK